MVIVNAPLRADLFREKAESGSCVCFQSGDEAQLQCSQRR